MCSTDITPPSFGTTCPSGFKVYADKGTTSRIVSFKVPRATDNSGKNPNVTTFGLPRNAQIKDGKVAYRFQQGQHVITYVAVDEMGLKKECSFEIKVQGKF